MTRGLDAGSKAAIAEGVVSPIYFVKLDYPAGMVRVNSTSWDWQQDLDGAGVEVYLGKGDLARIQFGDQNTEGRVTRARLSLTGVKQEHIALALADDYRNRPGKIWRGFLNPDWTLKAAPQLYLVGLMQPAPLSLGVQNTVSVELVSRLAFWERGTDAAIWDDADHQARRPGDLYHSLSAEIAAGKDVPWGVAG